jgi:5-methylcytosine-specific restriction endonuclease McrA
MTNIHDYHRDHRLSSCTRGFLVTGTPESDKFNRDLLAKNKTGDWVSTDDRIRDGDAMFLLLPHPSNRRGYPRELYVGVVKSQHPQKDKDNRIRFTVQQFHVLAPILKEVKIFLGGKVPPQGNTIQQVWSDLSADQSHVYKKPLVAEEDDESAFPEGVELYRLHRSRERDPTIVRKAKELRLKNTHKLECDVCSFDFLARYGHRGEGFIEAHHKIPVSRLDGKTKTKVAELALVCSNCHRMLHRGNPHLSIEGLRAILSNNKELLVKKK